MPDGDATELSSAPSHWRRELRHAVGLVAALFGPSFVLAGLFVAMQQLDVPRSEVIWIAMLPLACAWFIGVTWRLQRSRPPSARLASVMTLAPLLTVLTWMMAWVLGAVAIFLITLQWPGR